MNQSLLYKEIKQNQQEIDPIIQQNDIQSDLLVQNFDASQLNLQNENGQIIIENEISLSQIQSYNIKTLFINFAISFLSGMILGYDIGVSGGAILFLHYDIKNISNIDQENFISFSFITAAIGSLVCGIIADKVGRRIAIFISAILYIISCLLVSFAQSILIIYLGRLIAGFSIGMLMIVAVYLAEVSPSRFRGRIEVIIQISTSFGAVVAYLICIFLNENWRRMVQIGIIFPFLQIIAIIFAIESPRWLYLQQKDNKGKQNMNKIYKKEVRKSFLEMQSQISVMEQHEEYKAKSKFKELTTTYKYSLFVGSILLFLEQVCGLSTLLYFLPEIIVEAEIVHSQPSKEEQFSILISIPITAIACLGAFISIFLVDKIGRKKILVRSLPVCILALIILSISMLFHPISKGVIKSIISYVIIATLLLYAGAYSAGLDSICPLVNSEIYPAHLRSCGNSIGISLGWIANFAISKFFLQLTQTSTGQFIQFILLAIFCMSGLLFVIKYVIETQNKTLEQIQQEYKSMLSTEISQNNQYQQI